MNPEVLDNSWSSRRKAIILGAMVLLLTGIGFSIFWIFWHKAPTCFDKIKNGNETGVDCGGSCSLVCSSDALQPIVMWDPRMFEVSPGLWSVLVYVENPNVSLDATYVPYSFTIYDENNNVLEKREGATILPKNKTVGIFEGSIVVKGNAQPKRAVFELESGIVWNKNEKTGEDITVTQSPLLNSDSNPRVTANVKNNTSDEIKNVELIVSVFDGSDNAIAASRTFIESLKKNTNTDVVFTWPQPFKLGSKACQKSSDVMLLLDRSGSMNVVGSGTTTALYSAKLAADDFIDQLKSADKIGVVSFATNAKNPIDLNLTSNFDLAKQAVNAINIETGNIQYTNIFDVLRAAWQELGSATTTDDGSSRIAILLTDGVANNPRDPKDATEAEDIKYAENLASNESANLKKDGISIYTIGLGNNINETFLKSVASGDTNYFFAPSASNLETIYKNISSDICQEIPARIEITYKIFGNSV